MPEIFRVTVFGEPRAPWRTSRDAAMQDAIRLELASWDRSKREWFLPVPAEIERTGRREYTPTQRPDHRGQTWTVEQIDQLRALAEAGEEAWIVGHRLGRSTRAVRTKARELGIVFAPRRK